MADNQYAEDPEPCERFPTGPLYVPVRSGPSRCAARLFRTPLGERTAVGFTSERRLTATLGPSQEWIRLAEPALRALTAPLGVTTVTVDPQFTAPAPSRGETLPRFRKHSGERRERTHTWDPQAVGVLRVTGAAALVSALSLWLG
ncbi:SAV_915 family protein [Streptomyces gibsoniae]|uniref:SAV_915 family protein n=1 Tax=Streptomyces gibsoniae TaxID=3075529 RepID=A0ABU2U5A8_9ACTN|nr:SAV_915 family protein [Streptomyces sp. DSM 41699]MDT0468412.1 SAV_915 family protein [Streptomyces sp. DSM 41699]